MKLLIMQFSPTSYLFGPNILLSTLFSDTNTKFNRNPIKSFRSKYVNLSIWQRETQPSNYVFICSVFIFCLSLS
jgi:hypothetical protein